MMTATSTEQRTESSCAFLNRPPLRLRNVLQEVISNGLKVVQQAIAMRVMMWSLVAINHQRVHQDRAQRSFRNRLLDLHRAVSVILDGLDLDLAPAHIRDELRLEINGGYASADSTGLDRTRLWGGSNAKRLKPFNPLRQSVGQQCDSESRHGGVNNNPAVLKAILVIR